MCALEACKALDRHGKFLFWYFKIRPHLGINLISRYYIVNIPKFENLAPRRWNRTTASLPAYRFEACTPDHRRSSGRWELTSRSLYTQMWLIQIRINIMVRAPISIISTTKVQKSTKMVKSVSDPYPLILDMNLIFQECSTNMPRRERNETN